MHVNVYSFRQVKDGSQDVSACLLAVRMNVNSASRTRKIASVLLRVSIRNSVSLMLQKYYALCVDDDQAILNQLSAQLEPHFDGFCEFEYAESASEALAIYYELIENGERVWLLLCDQMMPDMQGDELLAKIHELDNRIVKVLLTGQAGLESAMRAINHAGLSYYMEKPWSQHDLLLVLDKLKFQYEMTFILNEINLQFASSINLDETLTIVFYNILNVIRAEAGSIFLVDENHQELICRVCQGPTDNSILGIRIPIGTGIVGHVAETRQIDITMDVKQDKRHYSQIDRKTGFVTRSMVSVPLISNDEMLGVIQVINKEHGKIFSQDDVNLLKALSNGAAIAIQNVKYAQRLLQEERIRSELMIAHQIQQGILPSPFPGHRAIHFEGVNRPAKVVSGDFYDYFQVSDDEFAFIIGDVCGKGVPASIFMASSRSMIKSQAVSNPHPARVMPMANRLIVQDAQPGMFVTVFYGLYNINTRRLQFTNAGHTLPLLLRRKDCLCSSLFDANLPMGLFDPVMFTYAEMVLEPGDRLILFTDGVNEAENSDGEQFGVEQLVRLTQDCQQRSPKELLDDILERLAAFTEGQEQKDDITLLIVQV